MTSADFGLDPTFVYPPGAGVVGLAVREGQPVTTPDLLTDPRITRTPGVLDRVANAPDCAVLAVPLLVRGRAIGALSARGMTGRVFGDQEVRLAQTFADQAAIAMENADLYQRLETRLDRLHTLTRLNQVVSASIELPEVLRQVARAAAALTEAPIASFWIADEATKTLTIGAFSDEAIGEAFPVRTVRFDQGLAGWIAAHRRPLNVPDVFADSRALATEWWRDHGLKSFHGVPVVLENASLAVLVLNGRTPFTFDTDDTALLESFVAQAAVAIRKAQAYEEARRRREAEIVAEIARDINADRKPFFWWKTKRTFVIWRVSSSSSTGTRS